MWCASLSQKTTIGCKGCGGARRTTTTARRHTHRPNGWRSRSGKKLQKQQQRSGRLLIFYLHFVFRALFVLAARAARSFLHTSQPPTASKIFNINSVKNSYSLFQFAMKSNILVSFINIYVVRGWSPRVDHLSMDWVLLFPLFVRATRYTITFRIYLCMRISSSFFFYSGYFFAAFLLAVLCDTSNIPRVPPTMPIENRIWCAAYIYIYRSYTKRHPGRYHEKLRFFEFPLRMRIHIR